MKQMMLPEYFAGTLQSVRGIPIAKNGNSISMAE
jgi:hypothetical protein